ncbi:endonuclease/exonuclease/phosphatase family protein [Streptomyces flavofungini]|uniref:Endonuclease/exonuclease/phosphatase n=1 Tax=Streptomyces flavofungini TaxID=68200 RepID=A0ABS0XGI6_9ACTN|nr:endonuclease/exonuclease/phosphatase family protein [Streptomyces flavofungini]MBJ3812343.1 endonuclease/exonuclease/phosphatase [Streptomyces flavofungini]GHC88321.1 hypothetical protein GCM10010349_75510 [Streptomyces flavofungini]
MKQYLQVATYNLLNGGRDHEAGRFRWDRWQQQMTLMRHADVDVWCVQEGKYYDEGGEERVLASAAALGAEVRLAPSAHHGCHLLTFVRGPKVRMARFFKDVGGGTFHHAVSRADVIVKNVPGALRVLNTHLAPFDPEARAAEVKWLTEYGTRHDTLLVGDLNCEAPGDPEPDSWDWLPASHYSRHRILNPDGSYGGLDKRAMHALLAAGFVDPQVQLKLPFARSCGYADRQQLRDHRSDYILPSRHLRWPLKACHVLDDSRFRELSDHLPVIATFEYEGGLV